MRPPTRNTSATAAATGRAAQEISKLQRAARAKALEEANLKARSDFEWRKQHGFVPPEILGELAAPHPANHAAFHCGEPVCSAFANVSLILATANEERAPLLKGYSDWFASLVFLVTAGGMRRCRSCRALVHESGATHTACHCVPLWASLSDDAQEEFHGNRWISKEEGKWNISFSAIRHLHFASAFEHAARIAGRNTRGFLVTHFDFFINVRIFHGAAFDHPWFPRRGQWIFRDGLDPVPRCFPVNGLNGTYFEKDKSWFWANNGFDWAKRTCKRNVEALGERECCYGWADIFYVPRKLHVAFGSLLAAFPDTHHEVAVPTSLRILSLRTGVQLRGLTCLGGTTAKLTNLDAFRPARKARPFCAHKLNLSSQDAQDVVHNVLHEIW